MKPTETPWSVDPLYGFIMDKNAEPIEICGTELGHTNMCYMVSCVNFVHGLKQHKIDPNYESMHEDFNFWQLKEAYEILLAYSLGMKKAYYLMSNSAAGYSQKIDESHVTRREDKDYESAEAIVRELTPPILVKAIAKCEQK